MDQKWRLGLLLLLPLCTGVAGLTNYRQHDYDPEPTDGMLEAVKPTSAHYGTYGDGYGGRKGQYGDGYGGRKGQYVTYSNQTTHRGRAYDNTAGTPRSLKSWRPARTGTKGDRVKRTPYYGSTYGSYGPRVPSHRHRGRKVVAKTYRPSKSYGGSYGAKRTGYNAPAGASFSAEPVYNTGGGGAGTGGAGTGGGTGYRTNSGFSGGYGGGGGTAGGGGYGANTNYQSQTGGGAAGGGGGGAAGGGGGYGTSGGYGGSNTAYGGGYAASPGGQTAYAQQQPQQAYAPAPVVAPAYAPVPAPVAAAYVPVQQAPVVAAPAYAPAPAPAPAPDYPQEPQYGLDEVALAKYLDELTKKSSGSREDSDESGSKDYNSGGKSKAGDKNISGKSGRSKTRRRRRRSSRSSRRRRRRSKEKSREAKDAERQAPKGGEAGPNEPLKAEDLAFNQYPQGGLGLAQQQGQAALLLSNLFGTLLQSAAAKQVLQQQQQAQAGPSLALYTTPPPASDLQKANALGPVQGGADKADGADGADGDIATELAKLGSLIRNTFRSMSKRLDKMKMSRDAKKGPKSNSAKEGLYTYSPSTGSTRTADASVEGFINSRSTGFLPNLPRRAVRSLQNASLGAAPRPWWDYGPHQGEPLVPTSRRPGERGLFNAASRYLQNLLALGSSHKRILKLRHPPAPAEGALPLTPANWTTAALKGPPTPQPQP